jgi:hypothetical protein
MIQLSAVQQRRKPMCALIVATIIALSTVLASCDSDPLLNVTAQGDVILHIVNADTRSVTIKNVIVNHDKNCAIIADKAMQKVIHRESQIAAFPGTLWTGAGFDMSTDCHTIEHVEIVTNYGSQSYNFKKQPS